MANNISLKKYTEFTVENLNLGLEYLKEKATAMKTGENTNNKTNASEKENSPQNQRS